MARAFRCRLRGRMKKIVIIITVAAVHFLATKGVIAITMAGALPSAYSPEGPSVVTRLLVAITRVLYSPLITSGLYPRKWFPGELINIPIVMNSLIWGFALYLFYILYKKIRPRA